MFSRKVKNFSPLQAEIENVKKNIDLSDVNPKETHIEILNKIGSGGFSNVYKINIHMLDEINIVTGVKNIVTKQLKIIPGLSTISAALKFVVKSANSGLESLVESYIMRHIHHQSVNDSWKINIDIKGNMNIYQSLALGDAALLTRKLFNKLQPLTLKRWVWQIVCGVAQLHKSGLCHCDIKAGNILIFPPNSSSVEEFGKIPSLGRHVYCHELDNTIAKLNDFSLSRFIPNNDKGTKDYPKHSSFTITHRPIEVWKELPYTFSADIWALGCTIYEIAYGELLFKDQNIKVRKNEAEANVLAFTEWAMSNPLPNKISFPHHGNGEIEGGLKISNPKIKEILDDSTIKRERHVISTPLSSSVPQISTPVLTPSFIEAKLSKEWLDPSNWNLNDLILSMLDINSSSRLNIWEIIEHEYFDEVRNLPDMASLLPPLEECNFPIIKYYSDGISPSIIKEANSISSNSDVVDLALSLYTRAIESQVNIPFPSIRGCIVVAHKILYRCPPANFGIVGSTYLQDEINLSLHLNYKFLPHIY
jgi:serine/threonine protein kinase